MRRYIFIALCIITIVGCTPKKPLRIALLTDIHVGTNSPTAWDALQRSIADINASDIDLVLISGDITENGDGVTMARIQRYFEELRCPYSVTSGNHETTWSPSGLKDFYRVFGDDKFAFVKDDFFFVGFNTGPLLRMSDGHVAPQDITWLRTQLETHKSLPTIVITHYPLREGDVDNWFEVTDLLRQYNVQVIIGGHYHRNLVYDADGIPNILGRSNLPDKQGYNGYTILTLSDSIHFYEKLCDSVPRQWYSLPITEKHYGVPDSTLRPSYTSNDTCVHIVWQQQIGGIYSTPTYENGRLFVGDATGTFYGMDVLDGTKLWDVEVGGKIFSTPCVQDGEVVFGSTNDTIYCLRTTDGSLLWKYGTRGAVMGCPIVYNNRVYIASSDSVMRALSLQDGTLLWTYDSLQNYTTGRPVVSDGRLLFGAWDCYFYALDITDGHLLWKWSNGSSNSKFSPAAVWPVVRGNKVFLTAPDRFFTCLDIRTGKELWRSNRYKVRETVGISTDGKRIYSKCMQDTVVAIDSRIYKTIWVSHVGFGYEHAPCMPVEKEGVLYVGTKNGVLYGLDAYKGKVLWQYKLCNSLLNTPLLLDDGCVVTSSTGTITLLRY